MTPSEAAVIVKKAYPDIKRLHLAGSSLRHGAGEDIDFVAVVDVKETVNEGKNKIGFSLDGEMKSDIFFTTEATLETFLIEYGLGKDNIRWKMKAQKQGLKLNRYGLWKGDELVTAKMAEIAKKLELPLKEHLTRSLEAPL